MSHDINKPAKVLQFLNKKGQGIVEFALILAFCAGIGLAAREAGFSEALDAAFAGTGEVAAPKDIQPGVSTGSSGSSTTVTIDESSKLPEKTDQKYTSMTSDEVKDFNFLNDLKDYFTNHPTDNSLADDIWNAYKGNRQFADAEAEARSRNVGLALLGKDLTGDNAVTDAVWKDLKADKNWAFDTDDQTIHAFLNNYKTNTESWDVSDPDKLNGYIDDLQTRNVYFANLEANDIANMLKNIGKTSFVNSAGNGSDFYDGYLEIKKQFWPSSVSLTLAPLITDTAFNANSDEVKIFNYVNGVTGTQGVVPYFEQYAGSKLTDAGVRLAKELEAFKQNNPYAVDDANDDNDNLTTAMFGVTKIENVSNDYWIQAKKNIGWVRDVDDNTIKTKLNEFVERIKTDLGDDANDADKVVEELVKRQAQFKVIGSTDAGKATIKKMISNMTEGTLDADAYEGYLAVKKQFWKESNYNIQLADLTANQESGGGTVNFYTRVAEVKNHITEQALILTSLTDNKLQKGDIVKDGNDYYVVINPGTYDFTYNSFVTQAGWGNFRKITGDYHGSDYVWEHSDGKTYYQNLNIGDIVIADNGDAYLMTGSGIWITYPISDSSALKLDL